MGSENTAVAPEFVGVKLFSIVRRPGIRLFGNCFRLAYQIR